MAAKTPAAKKSKIVQENRMFNEDWTTKYFFVECKRKAVCVICSENVSMFKVCIFYSSQCAWIYNCFLAGV